MEAQNSPNPFPRINQKKLESLQSGIDILELWIDNLVVNGIEQLSRDGSKIEEISTRMVDYGLSGIARKLRVIPEKLKLDKDWQEYCAELLAEFILFISAFRNQSKIKYHPEDILAYAGISIKKSEVISSSEGIIDHWILLGTMVDKEENLSIIRNWFIGKNTGIVFLSIDFQVGRFFNSKFFEFNKTYLDTVHFYPSAVKMRGTEVNIQNGIAAGEINLSGIYLEQALDKIAERVKICPWMNHQLFILKKLKFSILHHRLYLVSKNHEALICTNPDSYWLTLLSYSTYPEVNYIAEYMDKKFRILSVCIQGKIIPLKQK